MALPVATPRHFEGISFRAEGWAERENAALAARVQRIRDRAASATGDRGAASATGDQGAAMASGFLGIVKGSPGNALFAVERETWDGPIISVACGIVGADGIEADRWYRCEGGKLLPQPKETGRG